MEPIVIEKTLDQQISLFTLLTYFYAGHKEGDKSHSWKYEVGPKTKKITHKYAYESLRRLVEDVWKGKFATAIIYENLTNKQIYTNHKGVITSLPDVLFRYDEHKNSFLDYIEYHDMKTQRRERITVSDEAIKAHTRKNWTHRIKLLERSTWRKIVKEAVA